MNIPPIECPVCKGQLYPMIDYGEEFLGFECLDCCTEWNKDGTFKNSYQWAIDKAKEKRSHDADS